MLSKARSNPWSTVRVRDALIAVGGAHGRPQCAREAFARWDNVGKAVYAYSPRNREVEAGISL